jgi:quercetin dioxygenase-like cupin family protein
MRVSLPAGHAAGYFARLSKLVAELEHIPINEEADMRISHGRTGGTPSRRGQDTFTGTVYLDPVVEARPAVGINDVLFEPRSRTYWHSHERGQVLFVKAGEGYVGSRGGAAEKLQPGDVVYADPNEEHWHGAGPDSYLVHAAVSLGVTTWLEEVAEQSYNAASTG